MDKAQQGVKVTLWGKEAEDFVDLGNHPVLAVKGARVNDYRGKNLSTMGSTTLFQNPDITEAHELRGWYDSMGHSLAPMMIDASSQAASGSNNNNEERKLISQIKDENMGTGEKADWITVLASITYVKSDGTLSYPACISEGCNKKMLYEGPCMWKCERCQQVFERCNQRYMLNIQIGDESGQTWVTLFDETSEAILGISAEALEKLRDEDGEAFKKVFENALFKNYLFKLKVQQSVYNGETKIRTSVFTAVTPNYPDESKRLCDKIDRLLL